MNEKTLCFIKKATNKHNDKYDYSKVNYINNHTKICIICPEHGEFWQTPSSHLQGCGCPKCKGNKISKLKLKNTEFFIYQSNKIHNKKYNYSKVKYINSNTKVCIICPIHGEFYQEPRHHLSECSCPKCGNENSSRKQRQNIDIFIEKASLIHNNFYQYSKVNYGKNHKDKISILCPIHGEFWQAPDSHLQGQGCPKCGQIISKAENDIMRFLECLKPQQRNSSILNGKEIDIYIPSLKLGIEYNGLRWHSEEFGKDRYYHLDKLNECNKKSIKLIQIFEDEWINHRDICESKLKHICGLDVGKPKVFARKCQISEIKNKKAKEFLIQNHIQGYVGATVYLGCFNDGKLIGVMSFKHEKEGCWDLNRFATDIRFNCIGVGGKLFKYFTKNYDFNKIKSFADRRWTTNPTNNLYTKLGFEFVEFTRPDYKYFKDGIKKRFHKFGFRKQKLYNIYKLPLNMTEYEMTKELGYYRIWDCGLIKYSFKNDDRSK